MEYEVFKKMRQTFNSTGKNGKTGLTIRFRDLADFLQDWNKVQNTSTKISQLGSKLDEFGLGTLPPYDGNCASTKRKAYIGGKDPNKYPGVILPSDKGDAEAVKEACGS
jgi:hypothetical protein